MKYFHVCFLMLLINISYFNLYSMDLASSSSLRVPAISPSHSIRRASTAIQSFVHSTTPRAITPNASEDIFGFGSSVNPLTASGGIPEVNLSEPMSLDLASPEKSQILSNAIPSAAAEHLHYASGFTNKTLENHQTSTSKGGNLNFISASNAAAAASGGGEDARFCNETSKILSISGVSKNHTASVRRASIAINAFMALDKKSQSSRRASCNTSEKEREEEEKSLTPIITFQSPDNSDQQPLVTSSSWTLRSVAESSLVAATAAYFGSQVKQKITPAKRFMTGLEPMAAGSILSVGSTILSGAVPVLALAYGGYKLNNFIHSGCEHEKKELAVEFKKNLDAFKVETEKQLDLHQASIESRLDNHSVQVGSVLQEIGRALEDTGNSLEQIATIVGHIAPEGDLSTIQAIHKQATSLQSLGQDTKNQQIEVPKKQKCCCDCCIQ